MSTFKTFKSPSVPQNHPSTGEASAALELPTFKPVFADSLRGQSVVLAFKLVDTTENEHIINRIAVRLTCPRNCNIPGVFPSGQICHVELMMQVTEDDWRMFSINMMEGKRASADAPAVYEWGKVHVRSILPCKMDRYAYVSVSIPRERQHRMYTFLLSQLNGEFNFPGYLMNYIMPCAVGQRYGHKLKTGKKYRWMCAELIWSTLQVGLLGGSDQHVACRMSPNSIYEFCRNSKECCGTTNPIAKVNT
ncbi:hypothetical protein CYMTET_55133 [Cymbomonas tetramitiformis]|uniref:Uncharacterized protein n=1 Tax=Cymbomonas tetramitiformis TaxID=36881 RepID=A0AAE0BFB6_9CHLO|nr:hypothetical protein CYMTET_55133 [Cymbomonas tetramitiformis]